MARQNSSLTWVFFLILVLALAVFGVGVLLAAQARGWEMLAAGGIAVVLVLGLWALSLSVQNAHQHALRRLEDAVSPVHERLQQISVLLNLISEQQLISERAKSVAFREKDLEAIRRAVREDIARQDWEAALVLVSDIETAFGYRQEAQRLREEIEGYRSEQVRREVDNAVALIDRYCREEQWNQAWREAERLGRLFPDDPQVQGLPRDIEARRQGFKKHLLDSWQEAVAAHDVDGSIEILKKLDLYLTPSEAESMQDTARRVFKDKMQSLGQQFTLAVKNRQWAEAVQIGETLIRDFPNALMSREVAARLPLLRQRMNEPQAAGV